MITILLYGVAMIATALLLSALIVTPFVVAWELWKAKQARYQRNRR